VQVEIEVNKTFFRAGTADPSLQYPADEIRTLLIFDVIFTF
jgi:hypothetical protein